MNQIDSIYSAAVSSIDFNRDSLDAGRVYNASKILNYSRGMIMGLILYSKGSYASSRYDESFKYIVRAEDIAGKANDAILASNIMIMKGVCYYKLGFYKEADQTLKNAILKARTITEVEERSFYLSTVYTDLAANCQASGDRTTMLSWGAKAYNESLRLGKSEKYKWTAAVIASNRGNRFVREKQYDSAEFYLQRALRLASESSDLNRYKKLNALWVSNKHAGNFYYLKREFSAAESHYMAALKAAVQLKYLKGQKDAYEGLAKVCAALNRSEEASGYFEKSSTLNDSLVKLEKAAVQTPLEHIIGNKDFEMAENRYMYQRVIFLTLILLVFITAAVFFYRYKFKREVKLSAQRMDELIRKYEMNNEGQPSMKVEELKDVVQLAVNNNPAFLTKFREFDPLFIRKILNLAPGLVANEIEYCAFFRLNFETKEIARYTRTSVRGVEGKKYRIRKKLNIPSDQDINVWMNHV